jgi:phosphoenolpyruvate carboxylase
VTEQGEVIGQKYGTVATAAHNLELLLAGTTLTSLLPEDSVEDDPAMAEIFEILSRESMRSYRALIETPGFLEYFRQATPIDAVERSTIGSRPARRTGAADFRDLRAIPWVFSWSQARFFLPGWYGAGTALRKLAKEEPKLFRRMRDRLASWPFAKYVFNNLESGIASADLEVSQGYVELVKENHLREGITRMIRDQGLAEKERIIEDGSGDWGSRDSPTQAAGRQASALIRNCTALRKRVQNARRCSFDQSSSIGRRGGVVGRLCCRFGSLAMPR